MHLIQPAIYSNYSVNHHYQYVLEVIQFIFTNVMKFLRLPKFQNHRAFIDMKLEKKR